MYDKSRGAHRFYNRTRAGGFGNLDTLLSAYLPADYLVGVHTYMLKHNAWGVEMYIDSSLVFLLAFGAPPSVVSSGPPYAVSTYPVPLHPHLYPFIFFEPFKGGVIVPFDYPTPFYNFIWYDGEPYPPRTFRLYVTGTSTLMAGYSVSSGSVTSHPIPARYRYKTLYFMADQPGSLEIQVYTTTGNWRTYDTISVSAGALISYSMVDEAPLVRVVFTPTPYPATILEAEAHMS
jgi:hypothetical protein